VKRGVRHTSSVNLRLPPSLSRTGQRQLLFDTLTTIDTEKADPLVRAWGLGRRVYVDVLGRSISTIDSLRRKCKQTSVLAVLRWVHRGVVSQDLVRESSAERCEDLMVTHRSHRSIP
jgi:hypothetical protein